MGWDAYQLMYVESRIESFRSRSRTSFSWVSSACLADVMHSLLNVVSVSLCGIARWMRVSIDRRRTWSDMDVNMAVSRSLSLVALRIQASYSKQILAHLPKALKVGSWTYACRL